MPAQTTTIDADTGQPVNNAVPNFPQPPAIRPAGPMDVLASSIRSGSPWFWILVGAGLAFGVMYFLNKKS